MTIIKDDSWVAFRPGANACYDPRDSLAGPKDLIAARSTRAAPGRRHFFRRHSSACLCDGQRYWDAKDQAG